MNILADLLYKKDLIIAGLFLLIGIAFVLLADAYLLYLATSWLIFGLLALSLDLLWGKAKILSLGQTIFYGLGGYGGAIIAINFYKSFGNTFLLTLPFAILVGALIALVVGIIIFYIRMGELQITILTYTLTLIFFTFSISFSTQIGTAIIGGDNGMSNIPEMIIGFGKDARSLNEKEMFMTVFILAFMILLSLQVLMNTSFGKIIECIKLDIQKIELLGYDARKYQTILFVIAGGLAGLAGGLFALWGNYLNPEIFSVGEALLVPIYVLVGGLGTLIGGFLGSFSIGSLSFIFGGLSNGQTTLIIGAILILMVLFFDKGLMGVLEYSIQYFSKKKDLATAPLTINIDHEHDFNNEAKTFSTHKVYMSFGGITPVNDINLTFDSGKIHCIIGPNGAGKSSYLKTCMGIYNIERGSIYIGKENISQWQLSKRVQSGLGIKMQKPQVFKSFTVRENIWIAAFGRTRNKIKANNITENIINILGGESQSYKMVNTLSHGEQQCLDIAMVLSLQPSVILFDEPTAGMTSQERQELSKLMLKLAKTTTIILVEHDMSFIKTLEASVTVLHQGKVFANGTMQELHQDERILNIYLGRKGNV